MKSMSIRAKGSLWPRLLAALALLAMLIVGRYTYEITELRLTAVERNELISYQYAFKNLSERTWAIEPQLKTTRSSTCSRATSTCCVRSLCDHGPGAFWRRRGTRCWV